MPPKTRQPRCAYVEQGRRCRRAGDGNPPLCEAHRIVLEEEAKRAPRPGERLVGLLGRVLRGQKVTDDHMYGGIEDFVDMFSRPAGAPPHDPIGAARARAREWAQRANGGQAPRPKPKPAGPDPRVTLGFRPGQKLTQAEVKARHRELAREHHPDRGGDVRRMAAVNHAVDQLLAELG